MQLKQLNDIAHAIADLMVPGLDVKIETAGDNICKVTVAEPGKQQVEVSFNRTNIREHEVISKVSQPEETPQAIAPVKKAAIKHQSATMPTQGTIEEAKKRGRWWSRFHLERNIMRIVFADLQSRGHGEIIEKRVVQNTMSRIMNLAYNTCAKHVDKAIKMGLVKKIFDENGLICVQLVDSTDQHEYQEPLPIDTNYEPEEPTEDHEAENPSLFPDDDNDDSDHDSAE